MNLEEDPDIIAAEVSELINETSNLASVSISSASSDANQNNLDETFSHNGANSTTESISMKIDLQSSSLIEPITDDFFLETNSQFSTNETFARSLNDSELADVRRIIDWSKHIVEIAKE